MAVSPGGKRRELDSGLGDETGTSIRLQASLLLFLDQAGSALFREMSRHQRAGERVWISGRCVCGYGCAGVSVLLGQWEMDHSTRIIERCVDLLAKLSVGLPPASP